MEEKKVETGAQQVPPEAPAKPAKARVSGTSKRKAVKYVLWIVVILLLTNPALIPFLPQSLKTMLSSAVARLLGDVTQISHVLRFNWIMVIQLVIMVLTLRLLQVVLQEILSHLNPKSNRSKTVLHLAMSAQSYILVLLGIFWGLSILGVDVGTMLAGVGVVALIIGFGAESLIADVVTGVFMIFENEYNIGDIIEVNGFRGTVDHIGIRTTSLRDVGDNIKVMNNSDIRNLVNLSKRGSTAVCDFPVPYEADLSQVRRVLQEELLPALAEKHKDIFTEVPSLLGVQAFAPNAVMMRIVANVSEAHRFDAERRMREELKTGMEAHGMACPHSH